LVREHNRVKQQKLCCKNEKRHLKDFPEELWVWGHDKQSEKDVRQGQVVKSNGPVQLKHFTDLSDHKKLGKFLSQLLFSEGGEWREAVYQVLLSLYSSSWLKL
jgi:hypothetical protein